MEMADNVRVRGADLPMIADRYQKKRATRL
jgi:hypothetical protein